MQTKVMQNTNQNKAEADTGITTCRVSKSVQERIALLAWYRRVPIRQLMDQLLNEYADVHAEELGAAMQEAARDRSL
jgi:hypothetical protein